MTPSQLDEAKLKALARGTTPQGREILRKTLCRAERLLKQGNLPSEQIVAIIEREFTEFWALQPEFILFLSRIWGINERRWRQVSPLGLATFVVIRTAFRLRSQR